MKKMKLNIQLFASGSFEFSNWSSGTPLRGKIEWSSSPIGNENKSSVTARIFARRTSGSTWGREWNGYINIGGNNHSFDEIYTGEVTSIGTDWVLVEYFNDTINHNQDGSKTITISGEVYGPSGTSLSGKSSWGSTSATLDKIPRNSDLVYINDILIDDVSTAVFTPTINKNVPNYYDVLELICINDDGTVASTIMTIEGVTNGTEYSLDENQLNEIYALTTNSKEASIIAILKTYEDSTKTTQIGTTSQIEIKGLYGSGSAPLFYIFNYEDVNSTTLALTGDNQILISGYSNVKYTIPESNKAVPQKGATIISYGLKNNSGIERVTNLTYPIERTYNGYSQENLQVMVTDSRDLDTIVTINPYIISNYTLPNGTLSVEREDGVGEYVLLSFNGRYWNGNFGNGDNKITKVYYRAKQMGGNFGNWYDITGGATSSNGVVTINDLRIDNGGNKFTIGVGYTIELKIVDGISSSVQFNEVTGITGTISDGYVLDSYYKASNGYKFAINKIVEPNGATLQVEGDVAVDDDLNVTGSIDGGNVTIGGSPIIESGSNTNGNYIKYADGTMICTKGIQVTSSVTNGWGNMYESTSAVSLGNWAEEFYYTPVVSATKLSGGGCWFELIENVSKSSCGRTYLVSAVSRNITVWINIIGIGRWKA